MFGSDQRTRKVVVIHTVVALVLLQLLITRTDAASKCHKCTGINCQRTSYAATEECVDALDSCVTVFHGSTVLAQGCLGQLAVALRNKCQTESTANEDSEAVVEGEDLPKANGACYQCNEDLCNNVSGDGFECIQCDSNTDGNCASNPDQLQAEKCPIGRSTNSYCYTKVEEGKRAIRGCATNLVQQNECLGSNDCTLCSPLDISGCNREPKIASGGSDSGSGTGGDGSSSGGSGGDAGGSSGGGGTSGGGTGGGGTSGGGTSGGGTGGGGTGGGNIDGGGDSGGGSGGTGGGGTGGGGTSGSGGSA
ncbi:PREDICTED: cell wall protein IFF6-like, partial [Rhagoletis zephyria]|uniref:cell wall protein IFF6-like n=1 Tax=Rhagoletis zephyria TaxID=28612 RepID=UPI0008118ECF